MATVQHSTLTSGELHEPKGIDTASANEIYIANGNGSGSWQAVPVQEPKDIGGASLGEVYFADGAGSGTWQAIEKPPVGYLNYTDPVGTTLVSPSSFTVISVNATTHGTQRDFTNNNAGRLTYTGTPTVSMKLTGLLSFESSASNAITSVQIFINGVPAFPAQFVAEVSTSGSGALSTLTLFGYADLNTGDYVEMYVQTSAGNCQVLNFGLMAEGIL